MIEILLIVLVLLVVFGASKVRGAGSDLGAAVKGFRKELKGAARQVPPASGEPTPEVAPDAEFPEVLAARARGSDKPRV